MSFSNILCRCHFALLLLLSCHSQSIQLSLHVENTNFYTFEPLKSLL